MPRISSGLLMFRRGDGLQVLLVHPGGPFWKNKDEAHGSFPRVKPTRMKTCCCARCEFEEELRLAPQGSFVVLAPIKQKAGKIVHAWCFEGDLTSPSIRSNTFTMEWPPKSGKLPVVSQVDRGMVRPSHTRKKINPPKPRSQSMKWSV